MTRGGCADRREVPNRVYRPPVILPGFLKAAENTPTGPSYTGKMLLMLKQMTKTLLNSMLIERVPTSQVKQWLLAS